jgi:dimethylamine monooxygenase subunit A
MVTRGFVRSERQSLMKLPLTGAVVFSIHTYLVAMESLAPEVAGALKRLYQPKTF